MSITAEKTQNIQLVDDDTLFKALALDAFLDPENACTVASYRLAVDGGMPAWTQQHVETVITELLAEVATERAEALARRPHSYCGRCEGHFADEIIDLHREICALTGEIAYANLLHDTEVARMARKGAQIMRSIAQHRCIKCNRVLSNAQSVAAEIGPECESKATAAELALLKAQVAL